MKKAVFCIFVQEDTQSFSTPTRTSQFYVWASQFSTFDGSTSASSHSLFSQKWKGEQSGTHQRLTISVIGSSGEHRKDRDETIKYRIIEAFEQKHCVLHLYDAYLWTRRCRSSVYGKCRSVPPSIFDYYLLSISLLCYILFFFYNIIHFKLNDLNDR